MFRLSRVLPLNSLLTLQQQDRFTVVFTLIAWCGGDMEPSCSGRTAYTGLRVSAGLTARLVHATVVPRSSMHRYAMSCTDAASKMTCCVIWCPNLVEPMADYTGMLSTHHLA